MESGIGRLLSQAELATWPDGSRRTGFVIHGGQVLTAWHCVQELGGVGATVWLRLEPSGDGADYLDIPVTYVDHDVRYDAALLAFDPARVTGPVDSGAMGHHLGVVALPLGDEVGPHDRVRVGGFPSRNRSKTAVMLAGTVASATARVRRAAAIRLHVPDVAAY